MKLDSILPVPELFDARRILCIQPHYDDNDIGAGGTLALLVRGGAELVYLTVTDDLKGVVEAGLSEQDSRACLLRDQAAAQVLIGVGRQIRLEYPDAGDFKPSVLRRDLLAHIRALKPDFVLAPDPWLAYEAHPDHITTGLAAAEAILFSELPGIASSDPAADAAYGGHAVRGIAFYMTREPNRIVDVTPAWEDKVAAVRSYRTQFTPDGMEHLISTLNAKARQVSEGSGFQFGEAFKILHPDALHCGF